MTLFTSPALRAKSPVIAAFGQHEIKDDQVVRDVRGQLKAGVTVPGCVNRESFRDQTSHYEPRDFFFILDQQDSHDPPVTFVQPLSRVDKSVWRPPVPPSWERPGRVDSAPAPTMRCAPLLLSERE